MLRTRRMRIGLILSAWVLVVPEVSSAQFAPPPAQSQNTMMPPAAMMANPYVNPYMNPYLNPAATQQPMTAGNALLYLYGANQAKGGLGSGRLSGSRPQATTRRVAELPNSAASPGGGAARFFNPGPVNANGAGRYYNQRGRYFMNNGR